MSSGVNLLIYLAVGCVGGLLGLYSRIPAGTLLGTLLAVVLFKLFMQSSWETPKLYPFFCQVFIGVLIALSYKPGMFIAMGSLIIPIIISTVVLITCGALTSLVIVHWWPMDLHTAYIATSPGGMAALVPMAVDIDVDAGLIASFHFFRILVIVSTAPFIFKMILR